jgi:hypothetical protein
MSRHQTAKGREFNMQAFAGARGGTTAVGNTFRNAQGDLLGPGGKVIATAQQITNKVYDNGGAQTKTVKINPMEQEISRKEVMGADGSSKWEVTYADGSVEIIDGTGSAPAPQAAQSAPVDIDGKQTGKFEL